MNVFIVGSPLETAQALDKRRLNKQIIECRQILNALNGKSNAWRNHPCTIQYKGYEPYLVHYMDCLEAYAAGDIEQAKQSSAYADMFFKPLFHTDPYLDSMKRRLYTKDPLHYAQWAMYGTSDVNWYWSPDEDTYIYYQNGKRVKLC